MQVHLAASLIVLFGHGAAMACEHAAEVPAWAGTAPLFLAQSHVSDPMLRTASDAPMLAGPVMAATPTMVRTGARSEPVIARFTPPDERPSARSAPAAPPSAGAPPGNGATLLLVGLALMVGIAVRRRGAGRP